MNEVTIFTDGSCSPNPGAGGWGAILRMGQRGKQISGYAVDSTNNLMELTAIFEGIKALQCACEVVVVTDSQLAIGWLVHGWKRGNVGCFMACAAIEEEIIRGGHNVRFEHVKAHTGHPMNKAADLLANSARITGEALRLAQV